VDGLFRRHIRFHGAGLEPFEIEIHHVGSTAVPNIKAKPILDVLCIADVIEAFDALRHRMEEMDFVWKGEYGTRDAATACATTENRQ
jgi:GrpB-like predicted nucleotidyltransferase (UPF0157 family)